MDVAYVFHCSKCKFSHAGECVTKSPCVELRNGAYPAEGSVWRKQVKFRWDQDWQNGILWRVVTFDSAEKCVVTIRDTTDPYNIQFFPVEAWDEPGWKNPGNQDYIRFVKETP